VGTRAAVGVGEGEREGEGAIAELGMEALESVGRIRCEKKLARYPVFFGVETASVGRNV
jgi:hypothetical protein